MSNGLPGGGCCWEDALVVLEGPSSPDSGSVSIVSTRAGGGGDIAFSSAACSDNGFIDEDLPLFDSAVVVVVGNDFEERMDLAEEAPEEAEFCLPVSFCAPAAAAEAREDAVWPLLLLL